MDTFQAGMRVAELEQENANLKLLTEGQAARIKRLEQESQRLRAGKEG